MKISISITIGMKCLNKSWFVTFFRMIEWYLGLTSRAYTPAIMKDIISIHIRRFIITPITFMFVLNIDESIIVVVGSRYRLFCAIVLITDDMLDRKYVFSIVTYINTIIAIAIDAHRYTLVL